MGDIVLTDRDNYTNIANAIRSKLGTTTKYTPAQMPGAIQGIVTGGATPTYQDLTTTLNSIGQTFTPSLGYDALSSVKITGISSNTGYIKPSGNKAISENGSSIDVKNYATVSVNVPIPAIQSSKTATPTKSTQSITPDSGYAGLANVTVNPIPTNYIIPDGAKSITDNGSSIDVTSYKYVNVNVPIGNNYVLQTGKQVTPTESTQNITPDNGYDGFDKITVNPIPSNYVVPSGTKSITTNDSSIDVTSYKYVDVDIPVTAFKGTFTISTNTTSKTLVISALSSVSGFFVCEKDSVSTNRWIYTDEFKQSVVQNAVAGTSETLFDNTRMTISGNQITISFPSASYSKGTYIYVAW